MLSAKTSPTFKGSIFSQSQRARPTNASRGITTCQRTAHGTVLVNPKPRAPQEVPPPPSPATALRPLVKQPLRRTWHNSKPSARPKKNQTPPSEIQRSIIKADASGKSTAKKALGVGVAASQTVQQLVPNKAFPFVKHAGEQVAEGLHKPVGLVLASSYLLGTTCHLSGTAPSYVHILQPPILLKTPLLGLAVLQHIHL